MSGVIWSNVTRIVRTAKAQATANCASAYPLSSGGTAGPYFLNVASLQYHTT